MCCAFVLSLSFCVSRLCSCLLVLFVIWFGLCLFCCFVVVAFVYLCVSCCVIVCFVFVVCVLFVFCLLLFLCVCASVRVVVYCCLFCCCSFPLHVWGALFFWGVCELYFHVCLLCVLVGFVLFGVGSCVVGLSYLCFVLFVFDFARFVFVFGV